MIELEKLLAVAKELTDLYEDAHYVALKYTNLALAAQCEAEEAYLKYYGELEKSKDKQMDNYVDFYDFIMDSAEYDNLIQETKQQANEDAQKENTND